MNAGNDEPVDKWFWRVWRKLWREAAFGVLEAMRTKETFQAPTTFEEDEAEFAAYENDKDNNIGLDGKPIRSPHE